ncbi:MAG: AbrB/MazE/SpoVT family DNA-binding domain-containing protein [Anaerolineales bacterium]|nr:AbrB/MazE/SpoVT family DNA-binding domain-containing protein [Anaerolineales bacterium]
MNVKLSQKGWVVIPAYLREKYGLKPGANLQVIDYGGVLAIVPAFEDPVKEGAGMLKGDDSLTQAIVEEHRQERQRESR